jgi:hypothetical protein
LCVIVACRADKTDKTCRIWQVCHYAYQSTSTPSASTLSEDLLCFKDSKHLRQLRQILPNVASSGKSASVNAIGVDIGNGSLKLVSHQGETRIDSYLHYLSERASMSVHSGYVEYHSGDRC